MKQISIQTELTEYSSKSELSKQEQGLVDIAYSHSAKAHAPYSNFHVGCAILLNNNEIIGGSNQENASYPAGICAERTALSTCSSLYPEAKPIKMAIVINDPSYTLQHAVAPCGICRQSIKETETRYQQPIEIIFPGSNGQFYKVKSIQSLLPLSFDSTNLNNER